MKRIVESTRYITLVGVIALLLTSFAAFGWGSVKAYKVILGILTSAGQDPLIAVALMEVVDALLIATALFVFAASMYQMFIGSLDLPDWMLAHNLYELKAKLSSVVIVIMAVVFLEHLVEWKDAQQAMYFGIGITLVSAVLIAQSYLKGKD